MAQNSVNQYKSIFQNHFIVRFQCRYYTIVSSNQIRPNSNFHVSVSLHEATTKCKIRIGFKDNVIQSVEHVMNPYETHVILFATENITPNKEYILVAEGLNGIKFKHETKLHFNAKSVMTFIQTDKTIYKPGDTVRYRIIAMGVDTKPITTLGPIKISIQDSNANIIMEWPNVTTTTGVYFNELYLSENPLFGEWILSVTMNGNVEQKIFTVEKYQLPRFRVNIIALAKQSQKGGKISGTIRSKYTYGKLVKGKATISVRLPDNTIVSQKTIDITGITHFAFDLKNDLRHDKSVITKKYIVHVTVEERLTGQKQHASTKITVHLHPHTITMFNINGNIYKPGLPFDIMVRVICYIKYVFAPIRLFAQQIKVAQLDGAPVKKTNNYLKLIYKTKSKKFTPQKHLNSNGLATFNLPSADFGNYVDISVSVIKSNKNKYLSLFKISIMLI